MYYFLCGDELLEYRIKRLKEVDNIKVSESFLICADDKLYHYFLKITGLQNIRKCGLSGSIYNLSYGKVSAYETSMGINHHNHWIKICWQSKSGKIYHLHDEVDCQDIEFWLEGVDVPLVYKQLYGTSTLPFKLSNIHYTLLVGSISIALELVIFIKEGNVGSTEQILKEFDVFIVQYNALSEKKDRRYGVVHNWFIYVHGTIVTINLDLGSAGAQFLKKFLTWCNKFEQIEKVVVGNVASWD
jgi:hypothetical protein